MMSLAESFKPSKHTSLSKNEQNEREILQWRLLGRKEGRVQHTWPVKKVVNIFKGRSRTDADTKLRPEPEGSHRTVLLMKLKNNRFGFS